MKKDQLPKYVWEDIDRNGNVRIYVVRQRKPRKKIRIHAPLGTPQFWKEYAAALEGVTLPSHNPSSSLPAVVTPTRALAKRENTAGSFGAVLAEFYESATFKKWDIRVQRRRRNIFDSIATERDKDGATRGSYALRALQSRHIYAWRDALQHVPFSADELVKAFRAFFKWAVKTNRVTHNPARDVEYFSAPTEGFHTWTVEEVRQYEARHPVGTKARLALALMLFLGVRRSDVVLLGRQMCRGSWIHWTEVKGRSQQIKQRQLPILPALQAIIDATPSEHLSFLVTAFGRPFTSNGFGNWFRKRCDEAGLPHCSAHGLRKAGATIAAENGATEHQLMAIFGWQSPKQAAIYTKKVRLKKLAKDALPLIDLEAVSADERDDAPLALPAPGKPVPTAGR